MLMKRLTMRLDALRAKDSGYVLIVVIGLGAVMALMISTALVFTVSGTQKAQTEADWTSALAAANAGVEEYRSRIQNDIRYVKYGDKNAPFTKNSKPEAGHPDLNDKLVPDTTNPAFGIGTSGTWATVPGSDGKAQYRYAVNVQNYGGTGVVQLQATGKVGNSTRSIVVELKQQGLTQFVYFSDYETADPSINGDPKCDSYRWQAPRSNQSATTCDITFVGDPSDPSKGDQLLGMIHSNDQIVVCGATFGEVVESWADDVRDPTITTCGTNGVYTKGVVHGPKYELKASTAELKAETTLNDSTAVPSPGCLYTGPTTIKLESDGWMRVWSPLSKETQVYTDADGKAYAGAGTTDDGLCGAAGDLQSSAGAHIKVLDMNLVYVQAVPGSGDVNYSSTSAIQSKISCNSSGTGWKFATDQAQPNPSSWTTAQKKVIEHPLTTSSESMSTGNTPTYSCSQGDVFVSGTLSGRTTIAADRYFWVTDNLIYNNPNSDLLGIVGQQGIVVWNPINSSSTNLVNTNSGREVYGALTSNQHTIQVQNYNKGAKLGVLHVYGSMAMKYRGPVATGSGTSTSTGYIKKYEYDPKLIATNPPKYKVSTVTTFLVTKTAAVPAAYNADGSAR
jgi:hypothetical protein